MIIILIPPTIAEIIVFSLSPVCVCVCVCEKLLTYADKKRCHI